MRDCPSERFTWRDLWVIVHHSGDTSRLFAARNPKYAGGWTLTNRLLAIIANALRWLVWAKTVDGSKNRNRPEPLGPDMGNVSNRPGLRVKASPLSKIRNLLQRGHGGSEETPAQEQLRKIRNIFS